MCNTHKCFSKGNVSSTIGAHENEGECCLRRQETLPTLFCVIDLFDFNKGSKWIYVELQRENKYRE